jgi:type IV pilus assembly protein PilC
MSQLGWGPLAVWCRSMATMIDSGIPLLKSLRMSQRQQRSATAAAVFERLETRVRQGRELADAMTEEGNFFPTLLIDMVAVAEQTGALPDVFASLADHYDNLLRLRRNFLSQIAWPVFQLIAAVFIVAGLILILGWVADMRPGSEPFDPLGFGLRGPSGALLWLGYCGGAAIGLWIVYQMLLRGTLQGSLVYGALLKIPVVGQCVQDFALARFSWAYALTQRAGMKLEPSVDASLRATNNPAFVAASDQVVAAVMAGEDFADALASTGLFPAQYLELVRVGEVSGTVPETLQRLSPQLEEQARRSLSAMSATFSWLIWAAIATAIIFLIFRLAMFYVGMINDAGNL